MTEDSTGGSGGQNRVIRSIPDEPGLHAQAAQNPGGYVYEIDSDIVGPDPDGYVPGEAVVGAWIVGPDGRLTGEYEPNPHAGPPQDDFTLLAEPEQPLVWLPGDPAQAIRSSLAGLLTAQVPDSAVEWMKVTEAATCASELRPMPDDQNVGVLVRAGVTVPFAAGVTAPALGRGVVWGMFSWAAVGLDPASEEPRQDRVWLEFGAEAGSAREMLAGRLYQVDEG